jgi:hypothetical protein
LGLFQLSSSSTVFLLAKMVGNSLSASARVMAHGPPAVARRVSAVRQDTGFGKRPCCSPLTFARVEPGVSRLRRGKSSPQDTGRGGLCLTRLAESRFIGIPHGGKEIRVATRRLITEAS